MNYTYYFFAILYLIFSENSLHASDLQTGNSRRNKSFILIVPSIVSPTDALSPFSSEPDPTIAYEDIGFNPLAVHYIPMPAGGLQELPLLERRRITRLQRFIKTWHASDPLHQEPIDPENTDTYSEDSTSVIIHTPPVTHPAHDAHLPVFSNTLPSALEIGNEKTIDALLRTGIHIGVRYGEYERTALMIVADNSTLIPKRMVHHRILRRVGPQEIADCTLLPDSTIMHTLFDDVTTHIKAIQMLLEAGSNQGSQDIFGNTALMLAARRGHREIVSHLVQQKNTSLAFLNKRNCLGETALIIAAQNGHTAIVQELMRAGVYTYTFTHAGQNARMAALLNNHPAVVDCIDQYEREIEEGNSWIRWARRKTVTLVKSLIK